MKMTKKLLLSLAFMAGMIICAKYGIFPLLAYVIVIFAVVAVML